MANPQLTKEQLEKANELLQTIRNQLKKLSGDDENLLFAYRRKISKELVYDERSKPSIRRKLKDQKWKQQRGKCFICTGDLPEKGAILDRLAAIKGYVAENTRLICVKCDREIQEERNYS